MVADDEGPNDVAQAFEELRAEVTLMRRAVERLTAERMIGSWRELFLGRASRWCGLVPSHGCVGGGPIARGKPKRDDGTLKRVFPGLSGWSHGGLAQEAAEPGEMRCRSLI